MKRKKYRLNLDNLLVEGSKVIEIPENAIGISIISYPGRSSYDVLWLEPIEIDRRKE